MTNTENTGVHSCDDTSYADVLLLIDGQWRPAISGQSLPIENPANGKIIGQVACAKAADLDLALASAETAFRRWRNLPSLERSDIMRRAAGLVRERANDIARRMVLEHGKPFAQAQTETLLAADLLEWFAEAGRRIYGRIIPSRKPLSVHQFVVREPVGVVAAFTPWNFPINQAIRKIAAALASGCTIIAKGPEETPGSLADLVRCLVDSGLPRGVVSLVFGVPSEISSYLIPHPVVKKISFTGSTAVGKELAALAGRHMKLITMELGGHAPAIICDDANIEIACEVLTSNKVRNAGQVCNSPTRFLVQRNVYDQFLDKFTRAMELTKVGDGMLPDTQMGPLIHERRLAEVEAMTNDAIKKGATLMTGGQRIGNHGYFYAPTVLADVPIAARAMNEEPFGPIALVNSFDRLDEAAAEANRLSLGLASFVYSNSIDRTDYLASAIEAGMVSINHHGLGFPEVPFGGIKDSGYGSEGGDEALDSYLTPKLITRANIKPEVHNGFEYD